MSSFDQTKFSKASLQAIRESMNIVRSYQLGNKSMPSATVKEADQTLLTIADGESGQAAQRIMQQAFPEANFNTEDVGETTGKSSLRIMIDPIDGTKPFTNGLPTSTVIISAYDDNTRKVIACIIGEPISGRIWHTTSEQTLRSITYPHFSTETLPPSTTWQGELNKTSTVLLDISSGFTRSGKQILTDEQTAQLFSRLAKKSQILMLGSNGSHQAAVANGSDRMAGAITTAIGGPWDVCGVLLVLNAGGAAKAFSMDENRKLVAKNPLAVTSYDILVVGNNQTTVSHLSALLLSLQ